MNWKKVLAIFFIFFPLSLFSQGVDNLSQTNVGFTGGIGIPASDHLKNNYGISFNAGFHHEWILGRPTTMGWEFNFTHFAPKRVEFDPIQGGGASGYIKIQNNLLKQNDIQPFAKLGTGIGFLVDGDLGGHPKGIPLAVLFSAGGGANYLLSHGNKLFAEANYRYYMGGHQTRRYAAISFNIGISFKLPYDK